LKLKVVEREWDYTCADGCCYDYGAELSILKDDGECVFSTRTGDASIEYREVHTLLQNLGYELDIEYIDDREDCF
jgi:hypothetical protein